MLLRQPIASALFASLCIWHVQGIVVPSSAPSNAAAVDPSLVSVSIEFFAFPGYTQLRGTSNCLANLASVRGAQPAVRIGGTTQDRATYDANLQTPVNYTVASPADAPTTLTYGPSFFSLAAQLQGEVTLGLNRQLNNQANTLAAGTRAKQSMGNLFAIELGNEPDLYSSSSPIAAGNGWSQSADISSEAKWFTAMAPTLGNIFQGAVYLSWNTRTLVSSIGSGALNAIKTISRHSYPQSACGGASTNLPSLMSHSGIVSYVNQYAAEASTAHGAGKKFFLGETNSATCGGGGISPTFGAGLWIIDYVLQSALVGVERLYFHHGTIGNCAYCWWGQDAVYSPYYGAVFVSEFLGADGAKLTMLDNGTSATAVYAVYSSSNVPLRLLVLNSNYFDGTGTRTSTSATFTGLSTTNGTKQTKRLTAPSALSRVDQGASVTIGGDGTFGSDCSREGTERMEPVVVNGNALTVSVQASEAVIVYLQ
ncbi:glycoside hydrolase family 79 protein [Trametes sanguinea]|nr:glycoside hydrolase family 79 protein [Trametes sanguinea]